MKFASSSETFADGFARGELTQLEWLDLCANELELDGVAFHAAHFPRRDGEYLAQLKKAAVDLGLTVAALVTDGDLADCERSLETASALGAPLLVVRAPAGADDPAAWGRFTGALKTLAAAAKQANVTLGLRAMAGSLCANVADLARAAKDVDSAWLRYALDPSALAPDERERILARTVLAMHRIHDVEAFAQPHDGEATALLEGLARFRGFVVLDAEPRPGLPRDAYHRALERFAAVRAQRLAARLAAPA